MIKKKQKETFNNLKNHYIHNKITSTIHLVHVLDKLVKNRKKDVIKNL